jgi:tetratricopeptide (TPR) repeat protein
MQDYYEILQVHPKADTEAIQAAYERLKQRYDPQRLEGAADELVALARSRRDEIERAYLILSDATRRGNYDAERATLAHQEASITQSSAAAKLAPGGTTIDYRPLPPARAQERPRDFNAQPMQPSLTAGQAAAPPPAWVVPASLVGVLTFLVVLVSLFVTVTNRPPPTQQANQGPQVIEQPNSVLATPTREEIVNQFEPAIEGTRAITEQEPGNVNAWIEHGNALYDSVQVARELLPGSAIYIERLPRWIEAAEAYRQALELEPTNVVARADLGASYCYYGKEANDLDYVGRGLAEAQRAAQEGPNNPRALLGYGVCLAFSDPPQTQQAVAQWQQVIELPGIDPRLVAQARQLIIDYGS